MKSVLLCLVGVGIGYFISQISDSKKLIDHIEKPSSSDYKGVSKNQCPDDERKRVDANDYKKAFDIFIKRLGYKKNSPERIQYKQLLQNPKKYIEDISSYPNVLKKKESNILEYENTFLTDE